MGDQRKKKRTVNITGVAITCCPNIPKRETKCTLEVLKILNASGRSNLELVSFNFALKVWHSYGNQPWFGDENCH